MPVFFSFAQIREDLAHHTAGLPPEAVWQNVGRTSLGFHLKHLAGSVDRLTTYLLGGELDETQLAFLPNELEPEGSLQELLAGVERALAKAEREIVTLDPTALYDSRSVGRKRLPTTVLGLLVHLCEHSQRHLGQAIVICQALR